jgi:hypothetical protein
MIEAIGSLDYGGLDARDWVSLCYFRIVWLCFFFFFFRALA